MVVNDTKLYQNMKNKSPFSIKTILQNEKKRLAIIIKNYFH